MRRSATVGFGVVAVTAGAVAISAVAFGAGGSDTPEIFETAGAASRAIAATPPIAQATHEDGTSFRLTEAPESFPGAHPQLCLEIAGTSDYTAAVACGPQARIAAEGVFVTTKSGSGTATVQGYAPNGTREIVAINGPRVAISGSFFTVRVPATTPGLQFVLNDGRTLTHAMGGGPPASD